MPGPQFQIESTGVHGEAIDPQGARLFFSLYFAMTGLHALHMIVGIAILLWLIFHAARGRFTPQNHNSVEVHRAVLALRRHRVDLPLPPALPDRETLR